MNHYTCRRCLAAIGLIAICAQGELRAQAPEFRAMWVTRFEWPQANETIGRSVIDGIMQDLADANFNAVFFQVRGQADVLYPSPEEVWSPLIGGTDPGWDPLAHAIAAAHARGIEFHAYINTHTCWQNDPASVHLPPSNPNHLFYAHCNAADPEHRDWLHHQTIDNPVQFNESNYVWFAPGVPDYQAYTRRQIMHVVGNYDVDGVHFDRIRTPGSQQPSYDPISLARHANQWSNPDNRGFSEWTADQITRQVRDIHAAIMAVKPQVKVSAAVFPNPATAPTNQNQDAPTWAQTGGLDIVVPMMYFSGAIGSTWDGQLQQWLQSAGDRHVVAGHITSQGPSSLLGQIALTRTRGAAGNSVFSWSSFGFWNTYVNGVYASPAPVPVMPWKTAPTAGIIVGTLRGPDGEPVLDANVRRTGSSYTALSCADGFFSFLQVPPGTYTISADHSVFATVTTSGLEVGAGEVVQVDLQFTSVVPPGDFNRNGVIDREDLAAILFCLRGPQVVYNPAHSCLFADGDQDGDIDLVDFGAIQRVPSALAAN